MARNFYFLITFTLNFVICLCASKTGKVNNGTSSELTNFPCMVQLVDLNGNHVCGGCLINDENVVLAAQCVALFSQGANHTNLRVRGGDGNIIKSDLPTWQIRDVRQFVVHPEFNSETLENDIALLKLQEPFGRSINLHPVLMGFSQPKGRCYLPGWGGNQTSPAFSNRLHSINIFPTTMDRCAKQVKNTICCQGKHGRGGCKGDIGGPLACDGKVYGVFIGFEDACTGKPGVFTDIGRFQDWLEIHIHQDNEEEVDVMTGRRLGRSMATTFQPHGIRLLFILYLTFLVNGT